MNRILRTSQFSRMEKMNDFHPKNGISESKSNYDFKNVGMKNRSPSSPELSLFKTNHQHFIGN